MAARSILIRGGTVVSSSGTFAADVRVVDEQIVAVVSPGHDTDPADHVIDATGCFVMPGGVDTHTHLENPALGITRSADDFTTGTIAAACGGTTTIVDFAKKEPDAPLYDSFIRRRQRAESAVVVDIGFHPVVPSNALHDGSFDDMVRLTDEEGTMSWKFFMAYPGTMMVDDPTLIHGMRLAGELGVMPMVHAEHGHLVADATEALVAAGHTAERFHHDAHTHVSEAEAVHRAVAIARTVGSALFVVHVSSRFAAEQVALARAQGLTVFAETCPQYLLSSYEEYRDLDHGAAAYICSPPIREAANQEPLWNALSTGVISTIGTDHAAFTMCQPEDLPPQKGHGKGMFTKVPNGVPGIEERLMIMYEAGVVGGRFDICRFVDLVATRPSKLFGLYPRKGAVIAGADADLVIWDPEAPRTIAADELHHRADYSLYDGMHVSASPRWVIGRGHVLLSPDGIDVTPGRGRYLRRNKPVFA